MATLCLSDPIVLTRSVPVRHEVDVFVAGGGPAGVAAAVAAARQGARVYLAEGQVCSGGMGTAGALPMFCNFTDVHPETLEASEERGKDFDHQWLKPGESYGIPYRILTPRGLDNVLVAGRCVSTDRPVQGSLRVMPGCFITGQAAGVAAALAAERGLRSRDIAIPELQQRLRRLGAYLPN